MKSNLTYIVFTLTVITLFISSCNDHVDVKNEINTLYDHAWNALHSDPDSAIILASWQKSISEEYNDTDGLIKSNYVLGYAYYLKGHYDVASENYMKALQLIEGNNDTESLKRKVYLLQAMGVLYEKTFNHSLAMQYYLEALKIALDEKFKPSISALTFNLGVSNYKAENYQEANQYFFKSVLYYESIHDSVLLAKSYNSIGNVFNKQHDFELALDYYNKAISIMKSCNGPADKLALYISNLGENDKKQGNYQNAIDKYEMALHMSKDHGNTQNMSRLYADIGDLKSLMGNLKEANEDYYQSISFSDSTIYDETLERVYSSLIKNNKELGNIDELTTSALMLLDQREKLQIQVNALVAQNDNYKMMLTMIEAENDRFATMLDKMVMEVKAYQVVILVFVLCGLIASIYFIRERKKFTGVLGRMHSKLRDL